MDLAEFKAIIEGGKRTQAGQTAPAQGLHLTHIVYPADKIQSIE
jgi:tRNA U38,U39,U40 pseudouridine synthase TruA